MSFLESSTNSCVEAVEKDAKENFEVNDTEHELANAETESESEEFEESYEVLSEGIERTKEISKELERLQIQQRLLENKVYEIEEKLSKTGVRKKLKETYRLQISNAEQKQKMLAKRIALEKTKFTRVNSSGSPRGTRKTGLSKVNKRSLFYINSFTSSDVLERKTTDSPHRLFRGENSYDSFRKTREVYPECKDLGSYGMWQRLDAGKDKNVIDSCRLIIPRPPKTTNFFPPIPAPDAKKRPREKTRTKEPKRRLIPNSRRLASNRVFMYEKQLEFAMKYELETKDILVRLTENEELIEKMSRAASSTGEVSRQQLYLMGALSKEFLNNNSWC